MDISRKCCRLCLNEADFNVSLFGSYCRRTNMIEKILVCLKLVIEDNDYLDTICFKCAENIERYYEFTVYIRKCQVRYSKENRQGTRHRSIECSPQSHVNRRHVTSCVREPVYDADYTFSFLEIPNNEEKIEPKVSSPFFSYFSPPNPVIKQSNNEPLWKTPKSQYKSSPKEESKENIYKRHYKSERAPRHHSRDLFESQSQDNEEPEQRSLDWKLTPNNIIKKVRQKCFGQADL